jgi:O-antigen/teichoic acid export membrane protein
MGALSLKKLAIRGMFWTVLGYGASQILRFGSNLLLTRLLFPEFFGLMALVSIFLMGLNLFSDIGIGISIVQNKRGDEPAFLNTAWTMQVIRGFGLWLVCLAITYPVAQLYNEPLFIWLLPIVGFTTVIDGFRSCAEHTLERHLVVGRLTIIDLVAQVVHITVMLVWAIISPSVWALVGGGLVGSIFRVALSHRLIPDYKSTFAWDADAIREIFSTGRWVFLSTAIMFLAEQADRLMLGKLFPLDLLGIYSVSLMLSEVPRQIAVAIGHKVILPATSKIADLPRNELRSKILHHRKLLLLALVSGMIILVSFGDILVRFLYDARYEPAAWMLPILALGLWPRLLCASIETSLYSIGKMQYTTFANFLRLTCTLAGIWLGFQWIGVPGAVIGVALNDLFYYLAVQYGLRRERIGCTLQDIQVTLFLVGFVALMLVCRAVLGLGLPIDGMFAFLK